MVVGLVTDNKMGDTGAKALGPHLAKLSNMTKLELAGACLLVVGVCGGCDTGVGCGCG